MGEGELSAVLGYYCGNEVYMKRCVGRVGAAEGFIADSDRSRPGFRDDVAHPFRDDAAHHSEMMPPTIPG